MSFPSRISAAILTALWIVALAPPAGAQGRRPPPGNDDCVLDRCEEQSGRPQRPNTRREAPEPQAEDDTGNKPATRGGLFRRGPAASTGRFDFYVLSLSWSSGFCATNDRGGGKTQCDIGSNLGFVVHGLWPQYERGFPSDCDASARPPTRAALETTKGLFPDEGLARYEWRKHGTCSGKSAADYFADVRFAYEKVKIPKEFQDVRSEEKVSPSDITRAFEEANPRLRPGMMAVGCTRGVLQEVRICMSKDLRDFRPCAEVARKSCRSRDIRVPPIR